MPSAPLEYTASCNPPRKAKRALLPQPVLDEQSGDDNNDSEYEGGIEDAPVSVAPKRGRKPASSLSRSAKTAQRKLNHSIIEKARRTKINDALATLRQLVPDDYGVALKQQSQSPESDAEDDLNDGEYNAKHKGNKPKSRATGKKEAKEKEFKLEILVRTVSYMQDLLKRVNVLEEQVGTAPTASPSRKRRRDDADNSVRERPMSISPQLPSISSWLHTIDPALLPPSSQLPSPPSSAQFHAIVSTQTPPALSLDRDIAMDSTTEITAEDQSAASLLLQISSSPTVRASYSNLNHVPNTFKLPAMSTLQAETPSSWLGISTVRGRRNS